MLLRLACLALTNALAMLRLLPMTDRAKDVEILALRHQITVLDRQLHGATVWVPNGVRPGHGTGVDRAAHLPASATGDRRGCLAVLLRLAYLTVTNGMAILRLLPIGELRKNILEVKERPSQRRRNPGPAPPDHCPRTATPRPGSQGPVQSRRPGLPGGPATPTPPPCAAPGPAAGAPGDGAAVAPRSDRRPSRSDLAAKASRSPAHRAVDPAAGPAPRAREQHMGKPAHPR